MITAKVESSPLVNGRKGSTTPSYLPNNLTASSSGALAYSSKNEVLLAPDARSNLTPLSSDKSQIYQLSYLRIDQGVLLGVTSNLGLHLWSEDGDTMLFFYPLSSLGISDTTTDHEDPFMCGLTSVGRYVGAGVSSGNVIVFDTANNFSLEHKLETIYQPITCLASSPEILVAANDVGALFGFLPEDAFRKTWKFDGAGHPCTALLQIDAILFAAYATGHLRVYRTDIHEIAFEITAHVRCIMGLTYDDDRKCVASCSADQYVMLWSVPDFQHSSTSKVELIESILLENKICTGIAYTVEKQICVTAFDDDDLTIIRRY